MHPEDANTWRSSPIVTQEHHPSHDRSANCLMPHVKDLRSSRSRSAGFLYLRVSARPYRFVVCSPQLSLASVYEKSSKCCSATQQTNEKLKTIISGQRKVPSPSEEVIRGETNKIQHPSRTRSRF